MHFYDGPKIIIGRHKNMESDCDCDYPLTCRACVWRLEKDYFEAIALLVGANVDVSRFGIRPALLDAIRRHNELPTSASRVMKDVVDNRPNR